VCKESFEFGNAKERWYQWRVRDVLKYYNPTSGELDQIECDLHALDIKSQIILPHAMHSGNFKQKTISSH